jgi:hypothetical protein
MSITESTETGVEADLRMRDDLRRLADELPCAELHAALRFMQYLRDEGVQEWHADEAPIDDEPETEEERAAVEEARGQYERGEYVTSEQMRGELGLADA